MVDMVLTAVSLALMALQVMFINTKNWMMATNRLQDFAGDRLFNFEIGENAAGEKL